MNIPHSFYVEVFTPALSAEIQKKMFSFGYKWAYGDSVVSNTDMKYLFFDEEDNSITHSCDTEYAEKLVAKGETVKLTIDQVFSFTEKPKPKILDIGLLPDYPIKLKENGFYAGSNLIKREDFERLIQTAQDFWKENSTSNIPPKFVVKVLNPVISEEIQKKMFALGYGWCGAEQNVEHTDKPYLFFNHDDGWITHSDSFGYVTGEVKNERVKLLSIDEIFGLTGNSKVIHVGLLKEHPIKITVEAVKAGCQSIKRADFEDLAKNLNARE